MPGSPAHYRERLSGASITFLHGSWRFHLAPKPESVPDGFWAPDFEYDAPSAAAWGDITVPGNIETQGYSFPWYTNFHYPWNNQDGCAWSMNPPFVPEDNPTGCYRRTFAVPSAWLADRRRILLVLESADAAAFVWCDGHFVGYSQGSRTPSEFDLTRFLSPGVAQHVLAVMVPRWSDGKYLEDQDMWYLSGLARDVYLVGRPEIALQDFYVRTPLAFDAATGALAAAALEIDVDIAAPRPVDLTQCHVEVSLCDIVDPTASPLLTLRGAPPRPNFTSADAAGLLREEVPLGGRVVLRADLLKALNPSALRLWSAESPALYCLVVAVRGPEGQLSDLEACQVGLRDAQVKGRQLLHNGRPVLLYGVNRHEHDERHGKVRLNP